ncbi:family 78 glycoside hydrolase catalytic domain, partial [Chloroflexota bacterium]
MIAALYAQSLRCETLTNPVGLAASQPRFSWELVATHPNQIQTAYQILVADDPDRLATAEATLWDSGQMMTGQSNQIAYAGPALQSTQKYWWKVRVWDAEGQVSAYSQVASWQMGLLAAQDWQASWIGLPVEPTQDPVMRPPFYARRTFQPAEPVKSAVLFATARGCYKTFLNGAPVGDNVLTPGWTDYHKRIQVQMYDVTDLLQDQANVLAALVGDGWYAGYVGMNRQRNRYGTAPQGLFQLHITYASGAEEIISSDQAWQVSTGPIAYSDLLMGEYYDARQEIPGWNLPNFAATDWQPVTVQARDETPLVGQPNQPMRITQQIKPVAITRPDADTCIFDLGQNMVGWVRLNVSGPAGTHIQLRHGEVLNPDGTLYITNLRDAKQCDTYILKGEGTETFEPSFTFHGFRYVEVRGLTKKPTLNTLTGCVIHNDMPLTGSFECSNPMVNQLWQNILWGQRGNFVSIPTDCPQRNERLGWTGDAQVFIRTASFNMDVAAFFTKWMDDVVDGQSAAGGFPDFAPRIAMELDVAPGVMGLDGAPGWGDAGIIIPWTMYQVYGDTRVIETYYEAMTAWMDYIAADNPNYLRIERCNHDFSDWLSLGTTTPKALVATAYWAYCAQLMRQIATVIDRPENAQAYQELNEKIRASFIEEYLSPDGILSGDTQTAYALALHFDLIPAELRPAAVQHLVAAIERADGHIATGFLGTPLLCPVLAENGHADIAYQLLLNETYPSWGYMIKHGATTMWERWDGWTTETGFQDPDMNSFNHYAYGAIGEWLYRFAAGIDLDQQQAGAAGYKHLHIRPYPDARLSFVKAGYNTIYGPVSSHWWLEGDQIHLKVTLPPNTTATVTIPAQEVRQILDVDTMTSPASCATETEHCVVFQVGSGEYHFAGRHN